MSQLPIPLPLNESRWRYVTASGGGVTVAFLAGSGGSITLLSPEGENVSFRYGGVGGGIGLGMRLPRFGKVNLNVKGKSVGGAGALEALPSTGTVLVADGLVGRDLSRGDFTGPCMYVELGAGVIAGGSGTAILFGLDPKLLAAVAEIVTGAGYGRRRFRTGVDRFFPNKPIHSFEVSCLCPG